jgi:hypothetical protein
MMKPLAVAVTFLLISIGAQAATVVSVDGQDYLIDTINGSYTQHAALLEGQAWYGDGELAARLAIALDDAEGYPNEITFNGNLFNHTPLFMVGTLEDFGDPDTIETRSLRLNHPGAVYGNFLDASQESTFAVVSSSIVPIPASIWLLGTALAALGFRRAKTRAL